MMIFMWISVVCNILLVIVIVAMIIMQRRTILQKDRYIVRRLLEGDVMQKELDRIRMEKEALDKILESHLFAAGKNDNVRLNACNHQ